MLGKKVSRYRVLEIIGGGMGVVDKAEERLARGTQRKSSAD
jgi:hypothetical protein